jgi:hypothetical protein
MNNAISKIALHIELLLEQLNKPKKSFVESIMLEIIHQIENTISLIRTQLYTEQSCSVIYQSVNDPVNSLILVEIMEGHVNYLRDQITKPDEYEDYMLATISEIQKENDNLRSQLPAPEPSEDDDPN